MENSAQPIAIERNKSYTLRTTWGVLLDPGKTGYSNTIDFNVANIPDGATITKIQIHVVDYSTAGNGVVLADPVTLIAPDGTEYVFTWRAGLNITITNIKHNDSNGKWQLYFYGKNLSTTPNFWASLLYERTDFTIYYTT